MMMSLSLLVVLSTLGLTLAGVVPTPQYYIYPDKSGPYYVEDSGVLRGGYAPEHTGGQEAAGKRYVVVAQHAAEYEKRPGSGQGGEQEGAVADTPELAGRRYAAIASEHASLYDKIARDHARLHENQRLEQIRQEEAHAKLYDRIAQEHARLGAKHAETYRKILEDHARIGGEKSA